MSDVTMISTEATEILGRLANASGGLKLVMHSGAFDDRDDLAAVLAMAREQIEAAHAAMDRATARRR